MDLFEVIQQLDNRLLTEKQWGEKLLQVVDLFQFINCYDPSIKIVDWKQQKISIIEVNGIKKGLFLCDFIYNTGHFHDALLCDSNTLNEFREKYHINELWFAIVEEGLSNNNKASKIFIEENNISALYEKVFLFNFSQSKVETFKKTE